MSESSTVSLLLRTQEKWSHYNDDCDSDLGLRQGDLKRVEQWERVTRSGWLNLGDILLVEMANQVSWFCQEENREDCEERQFFPLPLQVLTHLLRRED